MNEGYAFTVYNEIGTILGEFDNRADANQCVTEERTKCAWDCGTDGAANNNDGGFRCGALAPHGIHVMVTDAEGNDRTSDPTLRF